MCDQSIDYFLTRWGSRVVVFQNLTSSVFWLQPRVYMFEVSSFHLIGMGEEDRAEDWLLLKKKKKKKKKKTEEFVLDIGICFPLGKLYSYDAIL